MAKKYVVVLGATLPAQNLDVDTVRQLQRTWFTHDPIGDHPRRFAVDHQMVVGTEEEIVAKFAEQLHRAIEWLDGGAIVLEPTENTLSLAAEGGVIQPLPVLAK